MLHHVCKGLLPSGPRLIHADSAGAIRRLAPALRRAGVEVTDLGTDKIRRVQVWHIARAPDGGSVSGREGSEVSEGSDGAERPPAGPTGREPSAEPWLFNKAHPGSSGDTDAASLPSLASLSSLPVPTSRREDDEADDSWLCDACGARVADGHECPGGAS